ncbi:TetR/AcrR family transcriptional regulator [Catenulispora yoronensis]
MSSARDRVLGTATRLFYAEGIHTVGVDRVIADASVAKATFYHHFKSKEDLVLAYLATEYERQRGVLDAVPGTGLDRLAAILAKLADLSAGPGFRGCPSSTPPPSTPTPTPRSATSSTTTAPGTAP